MRLWWAVLVADQPGPRPLEDHSELRWLRATGNPARARRKTAGGRPPAGTLNAATGKAYLAAGYAPRTINHALSVLSEFYRHALAVAGMT